MGQKEKVDWRRLKFKNRYLVLEGGLLYYYDIKGERALRAEGISDPKGKLSLANATMEVLERNAFKLKVVKPHAKEIIFECNSLEQKHQFCELISANQSFAYAQNSGSRESARQKSKQEHWRLGSLPMPRGHSQCG